MTVRPDWLPRDHPLAPAAVVATGPVAPRLAAATAERLLAGADLRAATGPGWLLVLGATADLPWADGVRYLGWESAVLVPTTERPSVPTDLLRTAFGEPAPGLLAFLPDVVLVGRMPARPADPTRLAG